MATEQVDQIATCVRTTMQEPVRSARQSKRSPGNKNRVVEVTSRILKASLQVLLFHVRQFLEDFRPGQSGGKEIEHIANAHAHAPDARTAPALFVVLANPQ